MPKVYRYVGPEEFASLTPPVEGVVVRTPQELVAGTHALGVATPLTFVVDVHHRLRLAPRQTEHVALARGGPVEAAGEVSLHLGDEGVRVLNVTNQSTGFCPESSSWGVVKDVFESLGVRMPDGFTEAIVFRRCEHCGSRQVVKDGWFVCAECERDLPRAWNF